ncbi:hypothetical protein B0H13DRAFT_1903592 [Mycena leptocephala]|nr:hypothetical protein B0H13DRAFT_1903592 [Mycena leptocephala]
MSVDARRIGNIAGGAQNFARRRQCFRVVDGESFHKHQLQMRSLGAARVGRYANSRAQNACGFWSLVPVSSAVALHLLGHWLAETTKYVPGTDTVWGNARTFFSLWAREQKCWVLWGQDNNKCHVNIFTTSLKHRVTKCFRDWTIFILAMHLTEDVVRTLVRNGGVAHLGHIPTSKNPNIISSDSQLSRLNAGLPESLNENTQAPAGLLNTPSRYTFRTRLLVKFRRVDGLKQGRIEPQDNGEEPRGCRKDSRRQPQTDEPTQVEDWAKNQPWTSPSMSPNAQSCRKCLEFQRKIGWTESPKWPGEVETSELYWSYHGGVDIVIQMFWVEESRWMDVREARGDVEIFAVLNCVAVFIGNEWESSEQRGTSSWNTITSNKTFGEDDRGRTGGGRRSVHEPSQ